MPKEKADILLTNGQLVDVLKGDVYPIDVAIKKDKIYCLGACEAEEVIDLNGRYIVPGFIDALLHVESTMLSVGALARAVVPHGTTTIMADPHDIVSILKANGQKYLTEASKNLPLGVHFIKSVGGHEPFTQEEAQEKLKNKEQIFICESPTVHGLECLVPLITPSNGCFFSFCSDNPSPPQLAEGHINQIIKQAVALKLDSMVAIQMATINTARYYKLKNVGVIAPGYWADIAILSDLEDFKVDLVYKKGKLVAKKEHALFEVKLKKTSIRNTVKIKPLEVENLEIAAKGDYAETIEVLPGKISTHAISAAVKEKEGKVISDPDSDVLKLTAIEAHKAKNQIGLGLVKGFGLKKGAIATSIAHDKHNIICVGVDDEDILSAVRRVAKLKGGIVVVRGGLVLAELPLPLAGLMSDQNLLTVNSQLYKIKKMIEELGSSLGNAVTLLSFLSLTSVPELRLTINGLFDVEKQKNINLFE